MASEHTHHPFYDLREVLSAESGLERVTTSLENLDPQGLLLRRITACVGWAVHGLVFEFQNGQRDGILVSNSGALMDYNRDDHLQRRDMVGWTDVALGDYITDIRGHRLDDNESDYLCHSVTLQFASGMHITYASNHEPWRGEPFAVSIPQACLVMSITFGRMQSQDVRGLVTSVHLPISFPHAPMLPPVTKQLLLHVLLLTRRIDTMRFNRGSEPLGSDVWWLILGFLCPWELKGGS